MKKFKMTWMERVVDHEGDTLHHEKKSQIIEAENEDAACDQWEKENEHNEYQNGLDDVVEIIETTLFDKKIFLDMPDGLTYAVPVEVIARDRAEHYKNEFNDDLGESLREDTIPLFLDDDYEITDWARNNMNWSDVKDKAITLKKKIDSDEYQEVWVNGEMKIK